MSLDYRESHLDPEKGGTYHARFFDKPHTRMVWELEKRVLADIMASFYIDSEVTHLDFACGTGRILSHLENRASVSVGVDISPSMLEVARQNNKKALILEADLTRNDVLGDKKFNLITAFRFFSNAQPELRKQAMRVIKDHLEDNGYLVFNNHKNPRSVKARAASFVKRQKYEGMSIREVKSLMAEFDMDIIDIYHLCAVPATDKYLLLPVFLLRPLEVFLSRLSIFRDLSEYLIFVCRKSTGKVRQYTGVTKNDRPPAG
jgi:SAM-dependent methyltransferase